MLTQLTRPKIGWSGRISATRFVSLFQRPSGGLSNNSLDNAGANPKRPADLKDAIALGPEFSYSRFYTRLNLSPTQLYAVLTCTREPGVDALPNYAALKFRKYTEHFGTWPGPRW
jgi:hypothetical protein